MMRAAAAAALVAAASLCVGTAAAEKPSIMFILADVRTPRPRVVARDHYRRRRRRRRRCPRCPG